ncbi:hypothetical protein [Serratia marcescens]|uniref:hypothetical protein n=1 Tax=Serratia marcescens TaxID=615 RepID=UPI0020CC7AFD|nr:hypothetical protein [Serratia marcescens]
MGKQPHSVGVERMGFKQLLLAVHLRGILSDGAFQVFQRENLAVFNHQIPKIAEIMRVVFYQKGFRFRRQRECFAVSVYQFQCH